ncbi:MAG TPA: diguanylate cyclase, partial [Aquificaceae bacterium]|nr:diguanylate cyclase [Aquificaceae bacterium]
EALLVAERIRQGFKRARININGLEVSTTLSAGVSTFTGSEDIDTLIKEADKALYQAKRTGRDKVVAYGTSP